MSAIDQAAQAITKGRDAVQGLRSSTVESNDLVWAVSRLSAELAADETNPSPAVFQVVVEGTTLNLQPMLRDEISRIAGEALRNAFRHAQARRIEVEIRYDNRRFRLRVRDDGKGIDPKVLSQDGRAGHYGPHGMRERAKLVGGKLDVWSDLDSGTEIELTIPSSIAYASSPGSRLSWLSQKLSEKQSRKRTQMKSGVSIPARFAFLRLTIIPSSARGSCDGYSLHSPAVGLVPDGWAGDADHSSPDKLVYFALIWPRFHGQAKATA